MSLVSELITTNCATILASSYDGQMLTVWSIRVALLIYLVTLSLLILDVNQKRWPTTRFFWTIGCVVFVAHVFCAFQFVHDWSHTNALLDTALQTREMTGLNWGGGVFFNYLFTAVWIMDVIWWWASSTTYNNRSRFWNWGIHGFFLFIAINATVVFETGPIRMAGVIAALWMVVISVYRVRFSSTSKSIPSS